MKRKLTHSRVAGAVLICCMVLARSGVAASITVNNFSFELLPPGGLPFTCPSPAGCAYSTGPIPDWALGGAGGQFQPGVQAGNFTYFNSVPDGIRVGYSNGGTLSQTVNALVQFGAIYTLRVDQGVRKDFPDPGQVELKIGQDPPVLATGMPASPGNWSTYTAQYVGTAADAGKPISIVLGSPGAQGDWDNVRLDVVGGTACSGECVNVFLPKPADSATQLTVVLAGDVRNQIDIAATADNATVNPFAYVDKNLFGGVNTSTVAVALDASGNTALTFTAGLHPILNSYSFNYGTATNGMPHYGYQGISASPFNVLSQTWTDNAVNTALPTASAACAALNGPATQFALLFADATQNGQTSGQWMECAVGSGNPSWTLDNPTAESEILSNIGYFLSPTEIPLELLNLSGLPPTNQADSPFIALSQFDGQVLGSNGSISISTNAPEPSSALLLTGGLLVLVGAVRPGRRRRVPVVKGQRAPER